MRCMNKNLPGLFLCIIIAIPAYLLGKIFPLIGGPFIAITIGMMLATFVSDKERYASGITFTSKKILQYAVILLGFGLNLSAVLNTGKQSFPIILCTITISLGIAYLLHKKMHIPLNVSTLIGIGSSICGCSAIAASAPVIDAKEEEVAQAISVIIIFNILAAILFPSLGIFLGFSKTSGEAFGIFAGTAINDTSSVTAAASTWDSMYHLSSSTLDKAVTVKLTRTLAIIPITLALALIRTKKTRKADVEKIAVNKIFPFFILYFLLASTFTTIAMEFGIPTTFFQPFKDLSKFFILMAMVAIGLHTDLLKLVKGGGKSIVMGFCCWICITIVSLYMQSLLGIW